VLFATDLVEETYNLLAGLGVEITCGLVGKDEARIVEQGTGNDDALLLTTGERIRHARLASCHIDEVEYPGATTATVVGMLTTGGTEHEVEVGLDAAIGEELEILKDDANLSAKIGQLAWLEGKEVVLVEDSGFISLPQIEIAVDGTEKGRLACPYPTDEINELTLMDGEVHVGDQDLIAAGDGDIFVANHYLRDWGGHNMAAY